MKLLFPLLLVCSLSFAQHQERKVFFYNVGFGGLSSGLGAVINKPKEINWKKAFVKGVWQGSIGGTLNYSGKKMLYVISREEDLIYAWPAKFLHHAGTSIIENAALNEPFLQNWNLNLGPVRVDFSLNGAKPFRARLLPYSIYSVIAGGRVGRFDVSTTLLTCNIAYKNKYWLPEGNLGLSYGRGFAYVANEGKYHTISHELVHQFQFNEYQVFNTYLKPLANKVPRTKVKSIFTKYIYFDANYLAPFYMLEGRHKQQSYYRNFYEFEAQRFSTNKHVHIE
jgi:hypothetical protein